MELSGKFRLSSCRKVGERGFAIYFLDYFWDHHQDNNSLEKRFFCLPVYPYHILASKYRYRIQND